MEKRQGNRLATKINTGPNKQMKTCSSPSIIKERQIETMKYHFNIIELVLIFRNANTQMNRGERRKDISSHFWWGCELK